MASLSWAESSGERMDTFRDMQTNSVFSVYVHVCTCTVLSGSLSSPGDELLTQVKKERKERVSFFTCVSRVILTCTVHVLCFMKAEGKHLHIHGFTMYMYMYMYMYVQYTNNNY